MGRKSLISFVDRQDRHESSENQLTEEELEPGIGSAGIYTPTLPIPGSNFRNVPYVFFSVYSV